ncbi:protein ITPRID2 [Astyanax mexicanus]|uniref:protein ITPRID2 n=1 Tax=Astyanax mexicanus TaxID=7994 RepID=UPI0020CB6618|nr:protein ITPRID2 [Astyanax mexicanus]
MESPSSFGRRQAWAHSSRRWLPLSDTEPPGTKPSYTSPPRPLSLQDEVFIEGCTTGKIETWLQGCGNEANPENHSQLTVESLLKNVGSFEDDLSLGAEATALGDGSLTEEFGHCPLLLPPPKSRKDFNTSTPQQKLSLPLYNMGHSMASSAFSSATSKTASSVSDVLQMCAEDAEETLYQLGFGCEEPQVTARIPARFFTFQSQLKGINFRLFLESQLRRIREEDPSLSLASRFRQVEVLTAMANAFYSLYSHVSRTPLQKLAPPEFSFSSPTVERNIGQRFFGSIRSEPRSPVERLKDTVSKMCLYTGSRGSDSTSPNNSPRKRNSLPDVVGMVLENAKHEEGLDQGRGAWLQDVAQKTQGKTVTQTAEVKTAEKVTNPHKERIQRWSQSGQRDGPRAKACLFKPKQDSKNETVVDESSTFSSSHSATVNNPANTKPTVAIITYDAVCPQVVESVHQAPYRRPQTDITAAVGSSPVIKFHSASLSHRLEPLEPKDHMPSIKDTETQLGLSAAESDRHLLETPQDFSHDNPATPYHPRVSQRSPCRITVTGWDGDTTTIPQRDSSEDPTSFMYSGNTTHPYLSSLHNQRYLSRIKSSDSQIKQANSFEMEEVQSAGEEENISAEQCGAHTLSVAAASPQKSSPLRGDSFQSDSSGYAEEDMQQHSLATHNREIS